MTVRLATVDLGTNTVRLLVVEASGEAWRPLHPAVHLVHSERRWRQHRGDVAGEVRRLSDLGIEVLNLHHRFCAPAVVAACHSEQILLFAWGVQPTWRMRRLIRMGVDGLMSDHVDRLLAAISGPRM